MHAEYVTILLIDYKKTSGRPGLFEWKILSLCIGNSTQYTNIFSFD